MPTRTPTVFQAQGTECGLAALAILLGHFGHHVTLEELRRRSGISRDGSGAALIAALAREYGLRVKSYRRDMQDLARLELPAIAHCRFNHFVVIEQVRENIIVVNDPISGPRGVPWDDFSEDFTGIALTFRPGPGLVPEPQRFNLWRSAAAAVRPRRWWMLLAGFAAFAPFLGLLGLAGALRVIADERDVDRALRLLVLAAIVSGCSSWIRHRVLAHMRVHLHASDSAAMLRHIAEMPAEFFSYRWPSSIAWLIQAPVWVVDTLCGAPVEAVLDALPIAPALIVVGIYSPVSATIVAVSLAVGLAASVLLYGPRAGIYRQWIHDSGGSIGIDPWRLQQIERIKTGSGPAESFAAIAGSMIEPANTWSAFERAQAVECAVHAALVPLTALAVLLVERDAATFGVAVGAATLGAWCSLRLGAALSHWTCIEPLRKCLQLLEDARQVQTRQLDPGVSGNSAAPGSANTVLTLNRVTFGYSRRSAALLREISFELRAGRVLGLAGLPGSGRTTLARLICGLLQPCEGDISLSGQAVLLERNSPFFEGSLRDNLALWDGSIDSHAIGTALDDACLTEVVSDRDGGLDSRVEIDGANFSGGQRQRIALARALAREPRLIILDEATDALDPDLEQRVIGNLRRRGYTCILIGLRPSSLSLCDEVIVINERTVAEHGSPQALAASGGPYTQLMGELRCYE